jgi:transcriptional regulator with XRE-family HTH domain
MARSTTQPTTELGRQLEKERVNRNLKMQGMADYLGVSKPTYLGWLRGTRPQSHHLELIAEKLDTKPGSVLGWVLVSSGLVITWKEDHLEWFPRPIDIQVGATTLRAA